MKKVKIFSIIVFLFFFTVHTSFADSAYVLPYPSFMPGNKLYILQTIYLESLRYWYFGDFGQFQYNLKMADKYLVEAKTLFEYKQYLLGFNSLRKSDDFFIHVYPALARAEKNNKNISDKRNLLKEASFAHIDVLQFIKNNTPSDFIWIPEKSESTSLSIHKKIDESILLRQKVL